MSFKFWHNIANSVNIFSGGVLKEIHTDRGNQLFAKKSLNSSETASLSNTILSFSVSIILESPTTCFLEKYGWHCFQKIFVSFELKMELK